MRHKICCARKNKLMQKIQLKKAGIIREILKWVRDWWDWDTSSLIIWKEVSCEADQRLYLGLIFWNVCVNYLGTKSRNATEICWCREAGRYYQGKGGFQHQENWRLFTTGVTEVRFKLENTKSHTLQGLAAERVRKISIWKFLADMTEKGNVLGEGHQGRNQRWDV